MDGGGEVKKLLSPIITVQKKVYKVAQSYAI
jgi:hypothetical protein